MAYDGFGARINDHYPIPQHYPGTLESPEELTVVCSCGEWEFFSQASAGGGCDTAWGADFEAHITEVTRPEPPARPEGAEDIESQIEAWDHEYGDDAIMTASRLRELADFLASRGVRVEGQR